MKNNSDKIPETGILSNIKETLIDRKEVPCVKMNEHKKISLNTIVIAVSCLLTVLLLLCLLTNGNVPSASTASSVKMMDTFQRNLTNQVSNVLEDIIPIPRTYVLNDSDIVAPKPNPDCYGQVSDPAQMQKILDQAATLLDGQKTLFNTDIDILEETVIHYYLDETIFVVTWKQAVDNSIYTFSEIKIAHPSQLRRFLSGGKYNSGILLTTVEMAESVNAVMASSGDFYDYRNSGVVVYEGQVYRDSGHHQDTCYIDENGDLLFTYAGQIRNKEAAEQFVEENNVRFSLCFGPVMVLDGEYCVPQEYYCGEINGNYARAALCQMDTLHYVVVDANREHPNFSLPTLGHFGKRLHEMGIPTVYALDGGQTATIAMNNQLINTVSHGSLREISDIFYFATALPESDEE